MPIYEYQCEKCREVFEKLIFAGDEEEISCPACSSREVTRIMSACSFMGPSIGTCAADAPKGFS